MTSRLSLRLLLLAVLLVPAAASAQSAESLVVRDAIAEYQRTGRARVLEVGQTILVPYGQVDPVLKTALLRTTLIELGRNEWVVDRFMGDTLALGRRLRRRRDGRLVPPDRERQARPTRT